MTSADATLMIAGIGFGVAVVLAGLAAHPDEHHRRETEKVWAVLGMAVASFSTISFVKWLIMVWPWVTW